LKYEKVMLLLSKTCYNWAPVWNWIDLNYRPFYYKNSFPKWYFTWSYSAWLGSLTDSKNLALSKAGNVLSAHVLRMQLHQMKRTASVSVKSHQVLLQSLIISKPLRPYKNVLFTGCLWFTYFPVRNFCALFQDCVILSQESCDGK